MYLFIIEKLENEELREQFLSIILSKIRESAVFKKVDTSSETGEDETKSKEEIEKEIKYLGQIDVILQLIELIREEKSTKFQ